MSVHHTAQMTVVFDPDIDLSVKQEDKDCPGRFVNPLVSREAWNTCMRTARELHLTC